MAKLAHVDMEDGRTVVCGVEEGLAIHEGDQCLFETERVLDYGRVARLTVDAEALSRETPSGRVVRCATLQDQSKAKENAVLGRMARDTCVAKAEAAGLSVRFVRVRYSFDRALLQAAFVAEDRLDVKELARAIAQELNTRVNLTQIGVRDEAAAIGGMGPCGRPLCCNTWLQGFDSVNVRMAKTQGLSLNPGAISGMCGRLKCCLRYEYGQYREAERRLPPEGAVVDCPAGRGRVCGRNLLKETVKVRLDSERIVDCHGAEARKAGSERRRGREERKS